MLHAWNVCGRNIQVPCRGLYDCPAITSHEALSYNSPDNSYTRFVCTECFVKHGGHLHIQQGSGSKRPATCVDRGLHCRDTTLSLGLFSKWIDATASSGDEVTKVNLLNQLIALLNNVSARSGDSPQSEDQTDPLRANKSQPLLLACFWSTRLLQLRKSSFLKKCWQANSNLPNVKNLEEC